MRHSIVKCLLYSSCLAVLTAAVTKFNVNRKDGKMLVLVPTAKESTSVKEYLVSKKAIDADCITFANRHSRDGIHTWFKKPHCWLLIGTTVVGAGVSNNLCDMVVHFTFAYTNVHLVQGMNRSGRDEGREVVSESLVIFNQNKLDYICGKRGSFKRKFTEDTVVDAIKVDEKTEVAARDSSTVSGHEDLMYRDTICRWRALAST